MRGTGRSVRRIVHVGRADFLQRIRSRRLLVVLAAIAYVGYLVNVGTVEVFYQDSIDGQTYQYAGEPTAAYIGLTAGVTGASLLAFVGYYVLAGSIERDETTDVDRIVASTPVTARELLLGKWCSHVGLVAVLLGTLAVAATVNHLVHGIGGTEPFRIVIPIFLLGMPTGCFVAGITLLFQATDRLSGTLGNVAYFFAATSLLIVSAIAAGNRAPSAVPIWIRLGDTIGLLAAGDVTRDALLAVAPTYEGPAAANFGTGSFDAETVRFRWTGTAWPLWFYANRLLLILFGIGATLAATVPYERFGSGADDDGDASGLSARLERALPAIGSPSAEEPADDRDPAETTLTPVTDRSAGGFGRLVSQELRLLVRGQPWWWYGGALAIGFVGLTGSAPTAATASIAAVWPIFLWSSMGVRPLRHRTLPFIVSSRHPYGQLLAEWTAGTIVAAAFFGVALWPTVLGAGLEGAVVLLGAVVFVPSLAQALGCWTRTPRVFELTYLLLWYAGPLNDVPPLDFAGATSETVGTAVPLAFGGAGAVALAAAFADRYVRTP